MKSVLEYLEVSAGRFPGKIVYADSVHAITFLEAEEMAKRLGSCLASFLQDARLTGAPTQYSYSASSLPYTGDNPLGRDPDDVGSGNSPLPCTSDTPLRRRPVAVFMEKSVEAILCFLGTAYAGGFYCPIDVSMPEERIRKILSVLQPAVILFREKDRSRVSLLLSEDKEVQLLSYEDAVKYEKKEAVLQKIRSFGMDTDPLYVLFTSGSTGIPKGVLVSHRVILRNMEWLEKHYNFRDTDVLGNQVPFYFDVSNHDIYAALKFASSMYIIPEELFSFPVRLVQFLNEKRITAIFWVPFALSMVSRLNAFKVEVPKFLRFVFFAGEVMPMRELHYWQHYLPDALYVNMYGPTETYVCTYYDVDRKFSEEETLPIGFPVDYATSLVLDKENHLVFPGEDGQGELCIRGDTLALGYYRDAEKTAERFVLNPLCDGWPERIYRTGDLVRYNAYGELLYLGRIDSQIKHLGYRIELGEIEAAGNAVPDITECACIYDNAKKRIIFYYAGMEYPRNELLSELQKRIPRYMLPNILRYREALPRNLNGKIDRQRLKNETQVKDNKKAFL